MRKWYRWQDWVTLVVGLALLLMPFQFAGMAEAARLSMILLGVLLGGSALWSLVSPGSIISEWTHAVLGLLTFLAPWVLGYSQLAGPAWTSWLLGIVAMAVGVWALPASKNAHRQAVEHH
jgi:uncharacterized membrane protein HdeD (DUF308 family)